MQLAKTVRENRPRARLLFCIPLAFGTGTPNAITFSANREQLTVNGV